MNSINVIPGQLQATHQANMEALIAAATSQFGAVEKIRGLQAVALKSAFEDTVANVRALTGAKDVRELVSLQGAYAQPAIEKAIAYSKGLYQAASQANAEVTQIGAGRVTELVQGFVSLLDGVMQNVAAAAATLKGLACNARKAA